MKETVEMRIGRYLAGEMSQDELEMFGRELAGDESLRRLCEEMKKIWELSSQEPAARWDAEQAIARFSLEQEQTSRKPSGITVKTYWIMAAASVILLLAAGYFLLFKPADKIYRYAELQGQTLQLEDGSNVYLNEGSTLTVHPFRRHERKVELSGEAYFEISPDKARPFKIECGETETEVVGTAFNLRQHGDGVALYVSEGKVIFRSAKSEDKVIALTNGEAADFTDHKIKRIPNPSPNVKAWHTHELWFKNVTLEQALSDVETYFHKKVKVEQSALLSCNVSSMLPLKDPDLEKVVRSIARILNAEVATEGEHFILRGGSCK